MPKTPRTILDKLTGGDLRSIGKADEVVKVASERPQLLGTLLEGTLGNDPIVRMRAADVIEKVTRSHPEYLQRYKRKILRQVAHVDQREVRWHVAQLIPRLTLNPWEKREAVRILTGYLKDKSSIVKTFSMQALADLTKDDSSLRPRVVRLLAKLTRTGTPAMKSRGRKLLRTLRGL
jgi:hypothetical protein